MRSDTQLKQDVQDELAREPAIDAAQIGVHVKDGIVTLTGHLDNFAAKHAAQNAAQRVAGVMGLAVEIDVRLPADARRTDAEIAHAARNILVWTSVVPGDRIHVLVENGSVSLTGTVDWNYQRRAAEHAVAGLLGVVSVTNAIVVRETPCAGDLQEQIRNAIERQAAEDAGHVTVRVDDGKVTLSGSLRTWAEREAAVEAAWSAPGVTAVMNDIQVNL